MRITNGLDLSIASLGILFLLLASPLRSQLFASDNDCRGTTTGNHTHLACNPQVTCTSGSCAEREATDQTTGEAYRYCSCSSTTEPACCHLRIYLVELPGFPAIIYDPRAAGECISCGLSGACHACELSADEYQPACGPC